MKQDVSIPGKNIDSPYSTNADDCAKRCDSLSKCMAWVFNPSDNRCWRKYGVSADKPYPGLWAGVKDRTGKIYS